MKIGQKMMLLIAVPILLSACFGIYLWSVVGRIDESVKQVKEESEVFAMLAKDMETDVVQVQQYLSDISATRAQDGLGDGFALAGASRDRFVAAADRFLQMYTNEKDAKGIADIEDIKRRFDAYYQTGLRMAHAYIDAGPSAGNRQMGDFDQASASLQEALRPFVRSQVEEAAAALGRAEYETSMLRKTAAALNVGIIALSIILGVFIIRSIVVPLRRMQQTIVEIDKHHDLTQRVNVKGNDEVGQTARAFNNLMGNLQQSFEQVLAGVSQVSGAAQSLSTSSTQVAQSSNAQSEATSSMAAAVEQMTVSINHVSDSAREAVELSRKSGELSTEGGGVIESASSEMSRIAETVHRTAQAIEHLVEHSDGISSIVQVIREVSDQTNLLALNAAIEAARAGEQGRGFAVVADEVRRLSERTGMATEEITRMIAEMHGSAQAAIVTMGSMVDQVSGGVELASKAGSSIVQIQGGAEQVVGVVNDISSALDEQSRASNEIACQVEKVAQMTEQNSAAAAETASTAARLRQLADAMHGVVRKFKIRSSDGMEVWGSRLKGELRMSA
jgi:methyl-accepting chemotaxis protein